MKKGDNLMKILVIAFIMMIISGFIYYANKELFSGDIIRVISFVFGGIVFIGILTIGKEKSASKKQKKRS